MNLTTRIVALHCIASVQRRNDKVFRLLATSLQGTKRARMTMIPARSSDTLFRLVVVVAGIALLSLLVTFTTAGGRDSVKDVSFRELVSVSEQDLASFLNQQAQDTSFQRALQGSQEFGDRCGNNNQCMEGMDCTEPSFGGNRCLPNSCFQETLNQSMNVSNFDPATYKEMLYQQAGYSESEILSALADAKNEQAFLETNEFRALQKALHANLQPLNTLLETSRTCVDPHQDVNGTVSYIGLHLEVSAVTII
jgi:hypothetical protein